MLGCLVVGCCFRRGAGLGPARGSASLGYVERGSSGAGA